MSGIIIVGGGIIGLCSAYYLIQNGNEVTVIDRTDMLDGCSYGNAGYVCPSHFVPLASPGNIRQGLKWMASSKSPFYIQLRLSKNLLNWGYHFIKSASNKHVTNSAIPLRDIALLSKKLYENLKDEPGFNFWFQNKGMLEFFKTDKNFHHGEEMVHTSKEIGIDAKLLTKKEVEQMEPGIDLDILGAVYYSCDAHLYPDKLMQGMLRVLKEKGVNFISNESVSDFITEGKKVKGVKTNSSAYFGDHIVLASGSWSGALAAKLDLKIPLAPGRGYSITLENSPLKLAHPVILTEGRVALTPFSQNILRIGGTMEITSLSAPPKTARVKAILDSAKKYFPGLDIPLPSLNKIWYGYRPCSADGLPYIGKPKKYDNLVIATGHAMIGLSLGAATGKLVSEIINEQPASVDIKPFDPDRFS